MGAPTTEPTAGPKFHDIVPDGDVTLVLYNPPHPASGGGKHGTEDKKNKKEEGLKNGHVVASKPAEQPREHELSCNSVSLFGPLSPKNIASSLQQSISSPDKNGVTASVNGIIADSENPSAQKKETREEIKIRVSSRHLSNASRVFRAMFSGPPRFAESLTLERDGHVSVTLPEDDPEVMKLVMSIIHLRSRDIPRSVGLDLLSRVAVVVDKYELHEALGFVTATWVSSLRAAESLPSTANGDLIKWLFVASVFELRDVLRVLETTAAGSARSRLDSWDFPQLPLPGSLVDSIERRRQRLVEQTLAVLAAHIQAYIRPSRDLHCFQQRELCDLAVLGSLVKGASNHGLYPPPAKPYEGYSPDWIREVLGTFVLGAGGKCVASGFMTCGASTLHKLLADAEAVRARAMKEESSAVGG